MMSTAARSGPGLEFADRRGEQIGTAGGVRRFGDGVFCVSSCSIRLAAPAGVPDPQASAATATCPRSTAGAESGSVLMAAARLRRTAAIPSPSSTRPQPSGKRRHLAPFLRRSASPAGPCRESAVSTASAAGSAVPAAGGCPAPRFAGFAAASARWLSSMRRRWRFRLVTASAAFRGRRPARSPAGPAHPPVRTPARGAGRRVVRIVADGDRHSAVVTVG